MEIDMIRDSRGKKVVRRYRRLFRKSIKVITVRERGLRIL